MIVRSLNVPGSPSAPLTTTVVGKTGERFSTMVRHLRPVGNPAPPLPRRPEASTSSRIAVAWRFLLVAAALFVIFTALGRVRLVVMPVIFALFLSAILSPPASWLRRHKWPPLAATWAVFVVAALVLTALGFWLVPRVVDQF